MNEAVLLKGMALVVVGIPMSSVENVLGIKAETLKKKMTHLLQAGAWDALDLVLKERFRLPPWHRSEFEREIVIRSEVEPEAAIFRAWGNRLRELSRSDRQFTLKVAARLVRCPVEQFIRLAWPRRHAKLRTPED